MKMVVMLRRERGPKPSIRGPLSLEPNTKGSDDELTYAAFYLHFYPPSHRNERALLELCSSIISDLGS